MENSKWNTPYEGFKNRNGIAMLFSLIFILPSCSGQVKKENENLLSYKNNNGLTINDTINKPKINVKVNKQYDNKGNIIKYDSTYSYVYRGNSNSPIPLDNDSIFNGFKSYFNIHSPGMFDKQNDNIFLNDSLYKYDFFNDDYFQKRFELNQKLFSDFYKQMDSMKENYLRDTYPDRKPKVNKR